MRKRAWAFGGCVAAICLVGLLFARSPAPHESVVLPPNVVESWKNLARKDLGENEPLAFFTIYSASSALVIRAGNSNVVETTRLRRSGFEWVPGGRSSLRRLRPTSESEAKEITAVARSYVKPRLLPVSLQRIWVLPRALFNYWDIRILAVDVFADDEASVVLRSGNDLHVVRMKKESGQWKWPGED